MNIDQPITHFMSLDRNLFMIPPTMAIQGRRDDIARAKRHERAKPSTKPQTKAPKKLATSATFSEIPCCTKSGCGGIDQSQESQKMGPTPTCVRRYACRDFTGPDIVEVGNILTEYCLKVTLSDTLRVDLTGIDPHVHVKVRAKEHSDTLEQRLTQVWKP